MEFKHSAEIPMLGSVSERVQGQRGSSLPLLFGKTAHMKMVPWVREPRKGKEKDCSAFAQFIPSSPQPLTIQPGQHVQTALPQAWQQGPVNVSQFV